MWMLQDLIKFSSSVSCEINGKWVPARPYLKGEPILWRIRDAWEVLMKRADAFKWPEGQ